MPFLKNGLEIKTTAYYDNVRLKVWTEKPVRWKSYEYLGAVVTGYGSSEHDSPSGAKPTVEQKRIYDLIEQLGVPGGEEGFALAESLYEVISEASHLGGTDIVIRCIHSYKVKMPDKEFPHLKHEDVPSHYHVSIFADVYAIKN